MSYLFKNAQFVKSALLPKDYPVLRNLSGDVLPEIAVVGRSNVGKSSLLNHLFQTDRLVKVSSIPGKTQVINFFTLNHELAFVDLPGYGYAKVPFQLRKEWGPMVQRYFEERNSLKGLLLLIDIRRIPTEEDLQMLQWAAHHQKPTITVITKIDKVNQSEKNANIQTIIKTLGVRAESVVPYSVNKGIGRKQLIAQIESLVASQ